MCQIEVGHLTETPYKDRMIRGGAIIMCTHGGRAVFLVGEGGGGKDCLASQRGEQFLAGKKGDKQFLAYLFEEPF
jgi:hypothetical protein